MLKIRKTYLSLILLHILVTVGFALVFGTSHPFASQYEVNNLYPLITSSMTLATILYALGGYLFVIATENKNKLFAKIMIASLLFTIILIIIWVSVLFLSLNGIQRNIWLVYIISNYPTAIILNSIINNADLHSWVIGLTIIPPALGFIIGTFLRLIYEPHWRKNNE